ncbi:MAG: sugar porter family MFS transporter [Fusobacteriaceae bacterium]
MKSNKILNVIFISFVASLGGFLFGYDTAVISGAVDFIQKYFNLSPLLVGWAVSSALVGCVFGSVIAAKLNEKYGRKKIMIVGAVCFAVSAYYSAVPTNFSVFVWARLLGGIGVGLAASLVPLYISEIAPAKIRGFLGAFFQISVAVGMLIVYFVNYKIANRSTMEWNIQSGWRWMFGSELIPAILFFGLLFLIPESPRWLLGKKKENEAKRVLKLLNNEEDAKNEFLSIQQNLKLENEKQNKSSKISSPKMKKVLILCIVLAFFQQVSGINVILYYTPTVLRAVSTNGGNSAYFQSVLVGVMMVVGAVFTSLTADRFGRKNLLISGTLLMTLFMFLMGIEIYSGNISKMALIYVMGYVLAFCYSAGPIVWLYISEILPNSIRARGAATASFTIWVSNILVSQTFPVLNDNTSLKQSFNGAFPFLIYGLFCAAFFFVALKIPETKGKTLEEIEKQWI